MDQGIVIGRDPIYLVKQCAMYLALRRKLCKATIRKETVATEQKVTEKIMKAKEAGDYGWEISERIQCFGHDA